MNKYKVFYRKNKKEPFMYYTSYSSSELARRSIRRFKKGFEAKIVIETKNKKLRTLKN